jgi:hypothetical protein
MIFDKMTRKMTNDKRGDIRESKKLELCWQKNQQQIGSKVFDLILHYRIKFQAF